MRGTRRWVLLAAVVAVIAVLAPAGAHASVDPSAESQLVARTNELRAGLGLPPLAVHDNLVGKARAWAQRQADAGAIFHSNLPDGVTADWERLGENVGRGPTVAAIHDALVASPSHYRNLTDPGFRYVGVGVVNANGTFYVAEVFMQLASQPAPKPASAAGTPTSTATTSRPASASSAPAVAPAPPPPPPPAPRLTAVLTRLHQLDLDELAA